MRKSAGQEIERGLGDLGGVQNDGSLLAAGSWQRDLGLWSVATGKRVLTLQAVEGLDAGYLITAQGEVEFVGADAERKKINAETGDVKCSRLNRPM